MSLARKHRERILAERAATEAAKTGDSMQGASEYELMLAKLGRDKNQLSKIKSTIAKAEKKRELLPDYEAYVDGVLISDAGVKDDCLTTIMLWNIDCLNFDRGMEIAEYCIKHKLGMPENFSRNLVTTVTEQIAEESMKNSEFDAMSTLTHLDNLTAEHDMVDEVRAKLFKAIGLRYIDDNAKLALQYLTKALEFNEKSGVKTLIKKLSKSLETE